MKKRRSLILLLTCLMLFTSIMSIPANAAEVDQTPVWNSGALPATEEQIAYWEPIAQAKRDARAAKQSTDTTPRAAGWVFTRYGLTYFGQQTNYTCGAASARMVIYNVANISLPESTVKTGCLTISPQDIITNKLQTSPGATLPNITNYINSQVSDYFSYAVSNQLAISTVCEDLYSCIEDYGYPAILGIDMLTPTYPFSPTEYSTATEEDELYGCIAHFVVVYGAIRTSSNKYIFKIADPWAGYVGVSQYRTYELTSDQLEDAYTGRLGYMF